MVALKYPRNEILSIYNDLLQNAVTNNLVNYLSRQYYWDEITRILKEKGNNANKSVITKVVNAELKKRNGIITLKIISLHKSGTTPEVISKSCDVPIKYVEYVISSI